MTPDSKKNDDVKRCWLCQEGEGVINAKTCPKEACLKRRRSIIENYFFNPLQYLNIEELFRNTFMFEEWNVVYSVRWLADC